MQSTASALRDLMARLDVLPGDVLDAIVEVSQDAVVICNPAGEVVTWDDTAARLFGYPAGTVAGRTLASLFATHFSAEVAALMAQVAMGQRVARFEGEAVREDGLPVPVSLSLSSVVAGPAGVGAIVVVARDVTEQRLAQATLAEVDALLRDSEALAHVGSWLWDRRTDVVQWSVEFHRLHGVDPLDFGGTLEDYLAVVHLEDRPRLQVAMEAAVASGRPFELDYRLSRGEARVLIQARPTMGSAGEVVGLRGVGRQA